MNRLIGDSKLACGYEYSLTPSQCQEMIDIIASTLNRITIKVSFNQQKTIRRHGRISGNTMILFPLGLNEGTVLHELSHVWIDHVWNHGRMFKVQQENLIRLWYG